MIRYKYQLIDSSPGGTKEEGTGSITDLERVIPLEILSILHLYEDDKGSIDLKIQAGNEYFEITKVQ
ncbi:hypothetical protein [Aquimarina celericrescens]|uniref:Uncharacterized protein n=1 Tax=Aquimarina celericrescens TaxID=1964542 RepID=A0ABW5AW36_9FLAO|nr:hypothetical protein [Aquimarina celericrescens]